MHLLFIALLSFATFGATTVEDHALVYESYVLEKSKKLALAIERMKKVEATESDSYFIQMRLGHLHEETNELIKATAYYVKAADLKPRSIEPWLALSKTFSRLKDYVKTKNFSLEALTRAPSHRGAGMLYVKAATKVKAYADGLEQANSLLIYYPNDTFFLEQKAFFLASLARKVEARAVIGELLLIDPDNSYARKFVGKNP